MQKQIISIMQKKDLLPPRCFDTQKRYIDPENYYG